MSVKKIAKGHKARLASTASNVSVSTPKALQLGRCERLCAPEDPGTNSSLPSSTAKSSKSASTSSKSSTAKPNTCLKKLAALCTCSTISVSFVVFLIVARIRYSGLRQPKFPDVVKFNSTTEPFEAKEIKLQELEKLLDKSLKATNDHVKEDSQGKYFMKEKDERGYAMFGFYDFHLEGVDQVERTGDVTIEPKAETPYATGDMQFTDLEYRGKAKWSWAFSAEDFNCTTPSYNFTFKISLPHPKTKKMELLEVEFPELKKYRCNRFHRYARHSRRLAKTYTSYGFRYLIQEFIVNSFKSAWESQQKGKKKK